MPRRYLFINASAKKDGSTVECGTALLEGLESEQIHLVDYRIGFFGQSFDDDEFDAVLEKMLAADVIVLGSPVYTETMSAAARTLLERLETHPKAEELSGREFAYFIQGYGPTRLTVESTTASIRNAVEPRGVHFLGAASDMVELAELRETIDAQEAEASRD